LEMEYVARRLPIFIDRLTIAAHSVSPYIASKCDTLSLQNGFSCGAIATAVGPGMRARSLPRSDRTGGIAPTSMQPTHLSLRDRFSRNSNLPRRYSSTVSAPVSVVKIRVRISVNAALG
jgi:hypothetical protein